MLERFWIWLSWKLPEELIYWASIRLFVITLPPTEFVGESKYLEILKKWRTQKEIKWRGL